MRIFGFSEIAFQTPRRVVSSAGSEHLPYKQGVGGSNPSPPTSSQSLAGQFFRSRKAFILSTCHITDARIKFTLVYDPQEETQVQETLLPLLTDITAGHIDFSGDDPHRFSAGEPVLLCLPDNQIEKFLAAHADIKMVLAAPER